MQRYIDAEQIPYVDMMYPSICKANRYEEERVFTKTEHNITRKEYIDEVPTADVQEVKHGRWKWYSDLANVRCSSCNRFSILATDFCPNCGARMDGEEN